MPNSAVPSFQNPDAYEQVMGRWSRRLAPLLIRFGGLSDDDRVLDVGCGTGSLAFTVAEIANVASVTGIDLTEPYVNFARVRAMPTRGSASSRRMPVLCRSRTIPSIVPSPCSYCNSSQMRPAQ